MPDLISLDAFKGDQSDQTLSELVEFLQGELSFSTKVNCLPLLVVTLCNVLQASKKFSIQDRYLDFIQSSIKSQTLDAQTPYFLSLKSNLSQKLIMLSDSNRLLELGSGGISLLNSCEFAAHSNLNLNQPGKDCNVSSNQAKEPLDAECLTPTYAFNPSVAKLRQRKISQ